jgi:hypothetical protein
MHSAFATITVIAWALAPGLLHAQQADIAAERARLGNDRARIEAERHAREAIAEQAARQAGVASKAAAPPPDIIRDEAPREEAAPPAGVPAAESSPPVAKAPPPPAVEPPPAETADVQTDPAEISRTLEQLRELGELKDAGYLTVEEFERIKQRILDRRF